MRVSNAEEVRLIHLSGVFVSGWHIAILYVAHCAYYLRAIGLIGFIFRRKLLFRLNRSPQRRDSSRLKQGQPTSPAWVKLKLTAIRVPCAYKLRPTGFNHDELPSPWTTLPLTRRPRSGLTTRKAVAASPASIARPQARPMKRNCRLGDIRCSFIRWEGRFDTLPVLYCPLSKSNHDHPIRLHHRAQPAPRPHFAWMGGAY